MPPIAKLLWRFNNYTDTDSLQPPPQPLLIILEKNII